MRTEKNRAEAALRAALRDVELVVVPPELDPGAVRRRLRRRRTSVVVALLALGVAAGAVVLPRAWPPDLVAGTPSASRTAPPGWRIEQYRTVSILVPDFWGYAYAPYANWCADSPDGQPTPERRKPYVALGQSWSADAGRADQGCPAQPDSLLTEHVELSLPGADAESRSPYPQEQQRSGWWIALRVLGPANEPVAVKVVSRDRGLAERIANSATVGGPCFSTSPVQRWGNSPARVDLMQLRQPDWVIICQYDPGPQVELEPEVRSGPMRGGDPGGLRATTMLEGTDAARLTESMIFSLNAKSRAPQSCGQRTPSVGLAFTARLSKGDREGLVYISRVVCIDPADANTLIGGVDDGLRIGPWTADLCDQLKRPPLRTELVGGTPLLTAC